MVAFDTLRRLDLSNQADGGAELTKRGPSGLTSSSLGLTAATLVAGRRPSQGLETHIERLLISTAPLFGSLTTAHRPSRQTTSAPRKRESEIMLDAKALCPTSL